MENGQVISRNNRTWSINKALEWWDPDSYEDWALAALALHTAIDGKAIWKQWAKRKMGENRAEPGATYRTILTRCRMRR